MLGMHLRRRQGRHGFMRGGGPAKNSSATVEMEWGGADVQLQEQAVLSIHHLKRPKRPWRQPSYFTFSGRNWQYLDRAHLVSLVYKQSGRILFTFKNIKKEEKRLSKRRAVWCEPISGISLWAPSLLLLRWRVVNRKPLPASTFFQASTSHMV